MATRERKAKTAVTDTGSRLNAKRAELATAEQALTTAQAAMDVDIEVGARARVEILRGHVAALEAEAVREAREALIAAAVARIGAIMDEEARCRERLEEHESGLTKAAGAYARAATAINATWQTTVSHRQELAALHDRFEIEVPELARLSAPEIRPTVVAAARVVGDVGFAGLAMSLPVTEPDDTGLNRRRRTYQEVAGTKTYELIERAGLKPWPPLSDQQRRTLERTAEILPEQVAILAGEFIRETARRSDPRLGG